MIPRHMWAMARLKRHPQLCPGAAGDSIPPEYRTLVLAQRACDSKLWHEVTLDTRAGDDLEQVVSGHLPASEFATSVRV